MNLEMNFIELVDIDSIVVYGTENVVDISVEGDESFVLSSGIISHNSAVSGMASVRDPEIHGGLPLKGKVMNVHSAPVKDVLDDGALRDLMNSIGLVPGQKADRSTLRYTQVYIAADADPDGMNITALLVNFFYTYWPELFDPKLPPVISVFMTPFVIAEKGKQRKYWYANNYQDFKPEDYKGWAVTRAKGLGTLTKDDWQHSLTSPVTFPIIDDTSMKETLDLIFNGKRPDHRKVWMGI